MTSTEPDKKPFPWRGLMLAIIVLLLVAMAITWFWYKRELEKLDRKSVPPYATTL